MGIGLSTPESGRLTSVTYAVSVVLSSSTALISSKGIGLITSSISVETLEAVLALINIRVPLSVKRLLETLMSLTSIILENKYFTRVGML